MAQTVSVVVTDDFDGTPEAQAVQFGLDGNWYTVDLKPEHEEQLRAFLTAYIGVGRKVGRSGVVPAGRKPAKGGGSGGDANTIREWARANGYPVNERGRIPKDIADAYRAAQQGSPAAPATADAPAFTEPEPEPQA